MNQFLKIVVLVIILCCSCKTKTKTIPWESLFSKNSLEGWNIKGGTATYKNENGTIVGTTVPNTPNTFLCSDKIYNDFILEIDFKVDPVMNSGIQIRSNSLPYYRDGMVHGYQVELDQ